MSEPIPEGESSEIIFAPEVGAAVMSRMTMAAHVEVSGSDSITSNSVILDVDEWTVSDGVVVSGEKYPATAVPAMICSDQGLFDMPRRVAATEVQIDADARWVAGVGYDGKAWHPFYNRGGDYLVLWGGGVAADGETAGTTPVEEPPGKFLFYDRYTNEYREAAAMVFTGSDMMTTRTPTWVSNKGVAAMAAMALTQSETDDVTQVIGFTTQDPTNSFGLVVQLRGMNRIELVVNDIGGSYSLINTELRREVDDVALFGLKFDAETSTAGLTYIDDVSNKSYLEARLRNIGGIPAGDTLASLDLALMPTLVETGARVFDVCAWTSAVSPYEWTVAESRYQEIYSISVRDPD